MCNSCKTISATCAAWCCLPVFTRTVRQGPPHSVHAPPSGAGTKGQQTQRRAQDGKQALPCRSAFSNERHFSLVFPTTPPLPLSRHWHRAGDPRAAEACALQHRHRRAELRRVRGALSGRERGVFAQGRGQIPPSRFCSLFADRPLTEDRVLFTCMHQTQNRCVNPSREI